MPAVPQQQKKRQPGRRSEPKLFRCTGFGNCDMVFTRSEHLARHARKHTGEKPFKCIVPNCDRTFSRFDNMMQHTHTHTRTKKKDDSSDGKLSPMSVPEDNMPTSPKSYAEYQKLYESYGSKILPAGSVPPPQRTDKLTIYPPPPPPAYYYQQHPPPPSPNTNDEYHPHHQAYYTGYPPLPPHHYMQPWPPVHYAPNTPPQYYQHPATAAIMVPPPPQPVIASMNNQPLQEPEQQSSSNNSSVPPTAENYSKNVRKNSFHSETTTTTTTTHRRLSYIALTTPIQELGLYASNSSSIIKGDHSTVCGDDDDEVEQEEEEDDDERQMSPLSMDTADCTTTPKTRFKPNGIDITPDEYEALQGFGKFCTEPIVREPMLMTRITTSPTCSISYPIPQLISTTKHHISPTAVLSSHTNSTSQVYAFRQQISTVQESFKRQGRSAN